jgi:hypothetical protein
MFLHCSTRRSWRLRAFFSWRACQRLGRLGLMGPGVLRSTFVPFSVAVFVFWSRLLKCRALLQKELLEYLGEVVK